MTQSVVGADVIKRAVHPACRAPSLHNSQPWRWLAERDVIHLFSDPTRIGRFTDSTGREVLMSCGAALDHFRIAMAAEGWEAHVDRFPNPNNLGHLATVYVSPAQFVTDAQRARAEAIRRRRTDRLPFAPPPEWESFEPVLRDTVDATVAVLDVIPDESRPQLAEASRLTEELRRYDSSYHAELQWWTTQLEDLQGIPPTALVSATEAEQLDVSRHFPTSGRGARRTETGQDRSKILVLSRYDDSRACATGAGE
ncbi:MAG: NAD(P)H nitroreductase, partial [Mycobacterium sp.]